MIRKDSMAGSQRPTHISHIKNSFMEQNPPKKPIKKKKLHGNEKPLKINMTFDQAMKKIAKAKPEQNK